MGFVVGEGVGGWFVAGEFDEVEDDADLSRLGGVLVFLFLFQVGFGFEYGCGFGERGRERGGGEKEDAR